MLRVPTAFAGFIDYAGVAPPARLPLAEALSQYLAERRGPARVMLRRLMVSEAMMPSLESLTTGASVDLGVALSAPTADLAERAAALLAMQTENIRISSLEILMQGSPAYDSVVRTLDELVSAESPGTTTFFEVKVDASLHQVDQLADLVAAGRNAALKVRCGADDLSDLPSPALLAHLLTRAARSGVTVKATAGLHHAHPAPSPRDGHERFGFMNVLTAAAMALEGLSSPVLESVLSDPDTGHWGISDGDVMWLPGGLSITRGRELFTTFGSCSFSEPVDELIRLGYVADAIPGSNPV